MNSEPAHYTLNKDWSIALRNERAMCVSRDQSCILNNKIFGDILSNGNITLSSKTSINDFYKIEKLRQFGIYSDQSKLFRYKHIEEKWGIQTCLGVDYISPFRANQSDVARIVEAISDLILQHSNVAVVDVPSYFEIPHYFDPHYELIVFIKTTGKVLCVGPVLSDFKQHQLKRIQNLAKENSVPFKISECYSIELSRFLSHSEKHSLRFLEEATASKGRFLLEQPSIVCADVGDWILGKNTLNIYDAVIVRDDCFAVNPILGPVNEELDLSYGFDAFTFYIFSYSQKCHFEPTGVCKGGIDIPTVGGKGFDPSIAILKAKSEALERYFSIVPEGESFHVSMLDDLDGEVVTPNRAMAFSENQYRKRSLWNASPKPTSCYVSEKYDGSPIAWSRMICDSSRKDHLWIPSAWLYHSTRPISGSKFCFFSSIGMAFADDLETALYRSLLELIERDAVAIWWYNKVILQPYTFCSLNFEWSSWTKKCLEKYNLNGSFLKLTTSFQVEVVVAIACDSKNREKRVFGFGASHCFEEAVKKATEELLQLVPYLFKDTDTRSEEMINLRNPLHYIWNCHLTGHASEFLDVEPVGTLSGDQENCLNDKTETNELFDLKKCISMMNFDICYSTRALKEGFLVKSFIEGLCTTSPRFGNSRLRSSALQLYGLDRIKEEYELNPVPLCL